MKAIFFGLGGIGQRHLRNLHFLLGDELEFAAYRVRDRQFVLTDRLEVAEGEVLESKYGLRTFHDLEQALAWGADAAFICNPSSLHIGIARAAAEAGCHVLIEKPLSHDLVGTSELAELLEAKGLVGLVAYQLRFHPCVIAATRILQSGGIGRIIGGLAEVGEYLPGWHPYEDYRQMYASRSDQGGGVILSQIHEMDYLYSFFGMPSRVFAMGGHVSSLDIDVEDTASILMEFSIEGRLVPMHLHQDYIQSPPSRGFKIIGEDGILAGDFRNLTITHFRLGEVVSMENYAGFDRNTLFLDEMRHFLACIRGQQKPVVTVRDGAKSLAIALAAKESLRTGLPIVPSPA